MVAVANRAAIDLQCGEGNSYNYVLMNSQTVMVGNITQNTYLVLLIIMSVYVCLAYVFFKTPNFLASLVIKLIYTDTLLHMCNYGLINLTLVLFFNILNNIVQCLLINALTFITLALPREGIVIKFRQPWS